MQVIFKDKKLRIIVYFLGVLFFLCVLSCLIAFSYKNYPNWVQSDLTGDLKAAEAAFKENSILSRNWYYGSELRILSPQTIYVLLFNFTSDYKTIRFVAMPIVLLIYLLSIYTILKTVGYNKYYFFIASLFILPFSLNSQFNLYVLYGLQLYTIPISVTFFCISIVLKLSNKEKHNWLDLILFIILLFFSILMGLNGVRQIISYAIPLFSWCLICFIFVKKRKFNLNNLFKCNFGRQLIIGLTSLVFFAVGSIIYATYLSKIYHVFSSGSLIAMHFPKLSYVWNAIKLYFFELGFTTRGNLFDIIFSNISCVFLLSILIIYIIILFTFRTNYKNKNNLLFILSFFIISIFLMFLYLCFVSHENTQGSPMVSRYYIFGNSFIFLLIPPILESVFSKTHKEKTLKYSKCFFAFGITSYLTFSCFVMSYKINENYHNIELDSISKFIVNETSFKKGYSSHWNGLVIDEISKNKVEMYAWEPNNKNEIQISRVVQSFYHEDFVIKDPCFAIFENSETYLNPFKRIQNNPLSTLLIKTNSYYVFGLETGTILFS